MTTATGPTATNLSELVERVLVDEHGAVEAYVEGDRRTTYAEWLRRSDAVAAMWREIGVTSGDVVAIALPSSTDFAVAYPAAVRLGAVVTGLNTRLGPLRTARRARALHAGGRRVRGIVRSARGGRQVLARRSGRRRRERPHAPPCGSRRTDRPAVHRVDERFDGRSEGRVVRPSRHQHLATMSGVLSRPMDRRLMPFPFAHAGYMTRAWIRSST